MSCVQIPFGGCGLFVFVCLLVLPPLSEFLQYSSFFMGEGIIAHHVVLLAQTCCASGFCVACETCSRHARIKTQTYNYIYCVLPLYPCK